MPWSDPRLPVQALVLVLFVGLAFVLPKLSRYHGDEKFYTDAAIRMVQTGDYWTPRYPDGTERFVKPVLTYWAIAGSYHLLGISYFSSRLPFLVAACLIILGTYQLARTFYGRPEPAALAALIIASNFQLLSLAIRSTPDALLCLFALLSGLGFARILFRGDRSFLAALLAYGGAGLAVQTKGLLGLCPVAVAWLFVGLYRRDRATVRALLDWKALLIGASLALFWYGVVFGLHGDLVVREFFHDQVTAKVAFNPLIGLGNLGNYALAAVRHFLPWTLLLLVGLLLDRSASFSFLRIRRQECGFLVGWFLLLAVAFSFGNMLRSRYLAASYPMLAVLLAGVIDEQLRMPRFQELGFRALRGVALVLGLFAVALAGVAARISPPAMLGSLAVLVVAAGLFAVARFRKAQALGLAFAAICAGGFLGVELLWRPLLTGSPAPALAAKVLSLNPPVRTVYAWNPASSYPSQMRVVSGGRLEVRALWTDEGQGPPAGLSPVLLTEAQKEAWPATHYVFETAAFARPRWTSRDYRDLLWGPHPAEVLVRKRVPFYLAMYQPPPR